MTSYWILWALADFDGFDAPQTYEQAELVGPNCHYIATGETYHPELLLDYLRWRYEDVQTTILSKMYSMKSCGKAAIL